MNRSGVVQGCPRSGGEMVPPGWLGSAVVIFHSPGTSVKPIDILRCRPGTGYIRISARLKNACSGVYCAPHGPAVSADTSYSTVAAFGADQVNLSTARGPSGIPREFQASTELTNCEKSR